MNLFPVTVKLPDGTTRTDARVVFYPSKNATVVWTWGRGPKPTDVARIAGPPTITSAAGAKLAAGTLTLADGKEATFTEQGSCGCGSKLLNYTPRHPDADTAANRRLVGT